MAEAAKAPDGEASSVERMISRYGGDPRAAVGALLMQNGELQAELDQTRLAVSFGYSRGWHRRGRAANG